MGRQAAARRERRAAATNLPTSASDATTAPGDLVKASDLPWTDAHGTTNDIASADTVYAKSTAELVDKIVHRGITLKRNTGFLVVAIAWVLFLCWLLSQDNAAGKLDTLEGIQWFIKAKVSTVSAIAAVCVVVIYIFSED